MKNTYCSDYSEKSKVIKMVIDYKECHSFSSVTLNYRLQYTMQSGISSKFVHF